MIDIRNEVMAAVSSAAEALGAVCVPGYTTGLSLPAITFEQFDNAMLPKTQTLDNLEHYAEVTFELNYYSNKAEGKQDECFALAGAADDVMKQFGFTRLQLRPSPDVEDAAIYRLTARYNAVVGTNGFVYTK